MTAPLALTDLHLPVESFTLEQLMRIRTLYEQGNLVALSSEIARALQQLRQPRLYFFDHQEADIGLFDGVDGPHDRVELQIFVHLGLLPDARRIDEQKLLSEFRVLRVNRIPSGARNVGHDVAVFPQQGVDERRFADIRLPDDGKLGQF